MLLFITTKKANIFWHSAKHFTCTTLFNSHSTLMRMVLLSLCHRCRKCSLERFINLPKATTVGNFYNWDTNPGSVVLPVLSTNTL